MTNHIESDFYDDIFNAAPSHDVEILELKHQLLSMKNSENVLNEDLKYYKNSISVLLENLKITKEQLALKNEILNRSTNQNIQIIYVKKELNELIVKHEKQKTKCNTLHQEYKDMQYQCNKMKTKYNETKEKCTKLNNTYKDLQQNYKNHTCK